MKFSLAGVVALVVTHVHIDHVGRVPYLMAAGFKGPIICSQASAQLLPMVLEDALKVGFTRNQALIDGFLAHLRRQIVPPAYKQWHTVVQPAAGLGAACGLKIRLQPAGHILGSAYVELDASWSAAAALAPRPVSPRPCKPNAWCFLATWVRPTRHCCPHRSHPPAPTWW